VTATEIRIDLSADVLFDFDSADIKPEAESSLQDVATVLKGHPDAQVSIEGHTDGKARPITTRRFRSRATASDKQWLMTNARVGGAHITTRGWGKSKPIAPNTSADSSDDPEGRAKNRRVEILVNKGA